MKNLIGIILILVSITNASSQEETTTNKDYFIGGSFRYATFNNSTNSSFDNIESTVNSFTLAPSIGYQLNSSWAVGIELGYSRYTSRSSSSTQVQKVSSVGLFTRHTFNPESQVKVFLQPEINYSQSKRESQSSNQGSKRTAFGIGASAGLSYEVSPKFRFLASTSILSIRTTRNEDANSFVSKDNQIQTSLSPSSLNLGIEFKF